jgi:hypothetical protein
VLDRWFPAIDGMPPACPPSQNVQTSTAVSVIEAGALFRRPNSLSDRALRLSEPVYRARRKNGGLARREMGCLARPKDGCFAEATTEPFDARRIDSPVGA